VELPLVYLRRLSIICERIKEYLESEGLLQAILLRFSESAVCWNVPELHLWSFCQQQHEDAYGAMVE